MRLRFLFDRYRLRRPVVHELLTNWTIDWRVRDGMDNGPSRLRRKSDAR